jgi:outer membrane protein assembly factor BamB
MKLIQIIQNVNFNSLILLNNKLIFINGENETICYSVNTLTEIWRLDNKKNAQNYVYENLLCNGYLTLYDTNSGQLFYEGKNTNFTFTGLNFEDLMLFKEVRDNEYYGLYFLNIDTYTLEKPYEILDLPRRVIYFDKSKILFRGDTFACFDFSGELLWEKELPYMPSSKTTLLNNILFVEPFSYGTYALDLSTGKELWQTPHYITKIDENKGLLYSIGNDFVVIDAQSGKEIVNIKNWKENQEIPIGEPHSPFYIAEDFLVVCGWQTMKEYKTGYFYPDIEGVYFIDKQTAKIIDFFPIIFEEELFPYYLFIDDKDVRVEKKCYSSGYMPIYKNGKLYIQLPSRDKKTMDLYVFEKTTDV